MMRIKNWTMALLCSALMAGCGENEVGSGNGIHGFDENVDTMDIVFSQHELALQKADSCDDYRAHLLDAAARHLANERFSWYYYWAEDDMEAMPDNSVSGDAGSSTDKNESAGEFTTTNVQEEGVDEVDTVKNDGTWMYIVNNNWDDGKYGGIEILKAWPANEMKKVATIPALDLDDNGYAYPSGLLLHEDRLIAIDSGYRYNDINKYGYYGTSVTFVRVYDVSDPTQPKLLKQHEMDGSYVTARMIDGRVHILMSASARRSLLDISNLYHADIPGVPEPDHDKAPKYEDYDGDWDKYYEAEQAYMKELRTMRDKYLPVIRAWLEKQYPDSSWLSWPQISNGTTHKDLIGCTDLYIPKTTSTQDGLLIMADISGHDFETVNASAIADYGWTVYASQKNIYVVSTSNSWYWNCVEEDDCRNYSHIHRFNIDTQGTRYINSGEVDGIVSDPFWMSEYEGHLRVAAEDSYWNGANQGSSLNVLKLDGPQMQLVGRIEDLGLNENLYAARMFGDKGYMVTFRQMDPLYTLDLSDPKNPKVMGELKITGYSSYIHPLGDNHLLTIGEDATEEGSILGLQLQIFDVSDMKNPVQAHKELIEISQDSYSYSEALYDHHAFTYHAGSGLLAVPVNIYDWSWDTYENHNFTGMLVYKALPDTGFERIGAIDHSDFIKSGHYRWWTDLNRSRIMFKTAGEYTKDAYIYTVSALGVKANNVLNPKEEFAAVKF
ncbi:MAG: beta-propeller domain-containing protein [Proteobacteria bacterium]|nr:beta-propeller domain-containing protein [Pseudomonadota bacterium]